MKKTGITTSAPTRQPAPESSPADMIEPAFHLSECRSLQIDTQKLGDKATRYLARTVARTPVNLIAQIQRTNIHLSQRDAEGSYGALLDLFIALGDKGISIRRRMLRRAKPLLTEEQFRALALCLDSGLSATDPMPPSSRSVLSKGLTGTGQLVVRINEEQTSPSTRDPLEEAIEHLEYSQTDKAREILEQALFDDPSRPELHSNLLAIYRASNDLESFTAMRNKLNESGKPLTEEWKQLAGHFAVQSGTFNK